MYPSLPPQFTNGNPPIVYTKTEPGHLQQIYATAWKSHRIQSRTREILNDEGEYGSSNIGGNSIFHTRKYGFYEKTNYNRLQQITHERVS